MEESHSVLTVSDTHTRRRRQPRSGRIRVLSQSSSQAEVDDNLNDSDDVQPTASVTNSAPPHANDNNIHAPIDDQDVKIKKEEGAADIITDEGGSGPALLAPQPVQHYLLQHPPQYARTQWQQPQIAHNHQQSTIYVKEEEGTVGE
eukprot:scaffold19209_cov130-Skeletonema_menzelii.AAC.1